MAKKTKLKLKIGERVDISLDSPVTYRTLVEDLHEDGTIIISAPLIRNIPLIAHREQVVRLHFYRDNGRFIQQTKVNGFMVEGNVRLIILEPLDEPLKQQRREAYRLKTRRNVMFKHYKNGPFEPQNKEYTNYDEVPSVTEDISETGICLRCEEVFEEGDKIYLKVFLDWPNKGEKPLIMAGQIRQFKKVENKKYAYAGIEFFDMPDELRRQIARYVLAQQQKMLRTIDEDY